MNAMSYRGEIKNGVVVFNRPPPFDEGTVVQVEAATLPRGLSGRELIDALRQLDIRWEGPPGELERLLAEVQAMREEDLEFPDKPSPLDER